MSKFAIRCAQVEDAAAIVRLLRELACYENLQESFCLTEAAVIRDMMGDSCHCEIAHLAATAAGVASWYWAYRSFRARHVLFIEDLFVTAQFRGHGLGRALLARLAAKACERNAHLEWQVLDWNAPSLEFYHNLGAAPAKNWLSYHLEGAALERLAAS